MEKLHENGTTDELIYLFFINELFLNCINLECDLGE